MFRPRDILGKIRLIHFPWKELPTVSEDKKKILFIGPKNPVLEEIRPQLEGTGLFGIHETNFNIYH